MRSTVTGGYDYEYSMVTEKQLQILYQWGS